MESSVFLYPSVKSSSKYTFAVYPRITPPWPEHVLGQCRMMPRHPTSGSDTVKAIFCYIYAPWAHLSLEYQSILSWNTTFSWSIYTHRLFADTRAQSPPKYGITPKKTSLPHYLLPFFSILSPPFLLRNSSILRKGSLTSLKYHSDTSKCLLKGPVLSEQPETPQTLPEHWPLRSLFTYNTCTSSFVCFQVI